MAGLLRCGHCGRKLHVAYGGTHGEAGRYHCKGSFLNHGGDRCISFMAGISCGISDCGVGADEIDRDLSSVAL